MKNKILSLAIIASSMFSMTGCLDMTPVSSITDENMWTNEGQFNSFVYGVHSMLRDKDAHNMFILGELRSDIYSPESSGWTTESNKVQEITANILSEQRPGLSNYANLYVNINQINLFIKKANETSVLKPEDKAYYLGTMYGMRAFYYFHLLRSWGSVVWQAEPSTSFEGNLAKEATPETEIMSNIKNDIKLSEESFANDYSFRSDRSFWSKSATLMLKAEVYLWSSRQMNGASSDAQVALDALKDIQANVSDLGLEKNFTDVFAYDNKANNEIIFSLHNDIVESQLFNGSWRNNMVPQQNTLKTFYASANGDAFDLNFNGNIYYPMNIDIYNIYDDNDTRKEGTLKKNKQMVLTLIKDVLHINILEQPNRVILIEHLQMTILYIVMQIYCYLWQKPNHLLVQIHRQKSMQFVNVLTVLHMMRRLWLMARWKEITME